jgi:CheY-like chemotaxis protein
MPVCDGYEATRRVRALDGAVSRIPIIALTANAGADDRRQCTEAGMNDFVAKPVELAALRDLLARWISRAGLRVAS